jgi:transcriptional regulator PpsR
VKHFNAPESSLGDIDAEKAAALLAAASDISLIIDQEGIVRDLAISNDGLDIAGCQEWVGKPWIDTVTTESKPKIEMLMRDAGQPDLRKWRQVNYASNEGADTPIIYSAVRLSPDNQIVAFGRDLRSLAALQQRLLQAQYAIERDYARLRHLETRYRLLFHVAGEAVLIVDAGSRRIIDANPAAVAALGKNNNRLVGSTFPREFEKADNEAIRTMMDRLSATGTSQKLNVLGVDKKTRYALSASLFRQDSDVFFLIRLEEMEGAGEGAPKTTEETSRLLSVLEQSSDALVITDPSGVVQSANPAFLEMSQCATMSQVIGQSLSRWLGRPGVDLNLALSNLQERGSLRLYRSTLSGELDSEREVEMSAVFVQNGEQSCIGFLIRDVSQRLLSEPRSEVGITRSANELANLVGRVPLKQIVQETTEVIERLCIETALTLTSNNRALAAEMLGVSRQGLYMKLHRHGISESEANDD